MIMMMEMEMEMSNSDQMEQWNKIIHIRHRVPHCRRQRTFATGKGLLKGYWQWQWCPSKPTQKKDADDDDDPRCIGILVTLLSNIELNVPFIYNNTHMQNGIIDVHLNYERIEKSLYLLCVAIISNNDHCPLGLIYTYSQHLFNRISMVFIIR